MTVSPEDNSSQGMYEEQHLDSPYIECVWRAQAVRNERYLVAAVEYWDIWFSRQLDGQMVAALSGPTVGHRWVESVVGEYGWGVQLRAHIVVPGVSARLVLGEKDHWVEEGHVTITRRAYFHPPVRRARNVRQQTHRTGYPSIRRRRPPRPDQQRRRLLRTSLAAPSTGGDRTNPQADRSIVPCPRSLRSATAGLTTRANAPRAAGFSDQAHLTRSLRAFHGQTPARILSGS